MNVIIVYCRFFRKPNKKFLRLIWRQTSFLLNHGKTEVSNYNWSFNFNWSDPFCSFFFLTTNFLQLLQATIEQLWGLFFKYLISLRFSLTQAACVIVVRNLCRGPVENPWVVAVLIKMTFLKRVRKVDFLSKRRTGSKYHRSRMKRTFVSYSGCFFLSTPCLGIYTNRGAPFSSPRFFTNIGLRCP
jgi:hypothetical protein